MQNEKEELLRSFNMFAGDSRQNLCNANVFGNLIEFVACTGSFISSTTVAILSADCIFFKFNAACYY